MGSLVTATSAFTGLVLILLCALAFPSHATVVAFSSVPYSVLSATRPELSLPTSSSSTSSSFSSSSGSRLEAFRDFNDGVGGRPHSDRDRREEERRTYQRHRQRRQQFARRQQQERAQQEAEEAAELERQQQIARQAQKAEAVAFIALQEHEKELLKEQEKFEVERSHLRSLITEQRHQLEALRQSETKLRSKQQMQLGHYNHYHDHQESSGSLTALSPDSVGTVSLPIADVNLSMLWNENQQSKVKRITSRLHLLKEENERLTEQLEIEKMRFVAEKTWMEQKLQEKEVEAEEVKDELRLERELFKTTLSLMEINLEREQKKVKVLEDALSHRGDPNEVQQTQGTGQQPVQPYLEQLEHQALKQRQQQQQAHDDEHMKHPTIDPELLSTTTIHQNEPPKNAHVKYYQPPNQEHHQEYEPPQHHYYHQSQQGQQPQSPGQPVHHHSHQQTQARDAFSAFYDRKGASEAVTSATTATHPQSTQPDEYYYYDTYNSYAHQPKHRANSAMPPTMRPDQAYPDSRGGSSNNHHQTRKTTRFRHYGASGGLRDMGDFGNNFYL